MSRSMDPVPATTALMTLSTSSSNRGMKQETTLIRYTVKVFPHKHGAFRYAHLAMSSSRDSLADNFALPSLFMFFRMHMIGNWQ